MYQRILVCTDGSPLSKKAVASAIAMARLCGAELFALKVVPRYPQNYFDGSEGLLADDAARIEAMWQQQAQSVVDTVKRQALAKGVHTKALTVRADSIADAILAVTAKQRCDLIVMASHGRRGVKRLLLGSETQHVLTRSQVPVLVLR